MGIAKLDQYGLLQVTGEDARAFLHAQLTSDMESLAPGHARYAGWCSAKGRLLATFLVVARSDGFLLQLARDLAPAVAKRLSMFVLRAKVKLADVSGQWEQYGDWGRNEPAGELQVAEHDGTVAVRIDSKRVLLLTAKAQASEAPAEQWSLAEIRAGRPLVVLATQDQFVPQMLNLELFGAVDFKKGCYPGQEIVARAQYRGAVKRRMIRVRGEGLQAGQELFADGEAGGTVVNAASGEALAVVSVAAIESGAALRLHAQGTEIERLPLPYAQ